MTDGAAQTGFQVWVRRTDDPEAPYALRFTVHGGKGILRVARPGVLIDPPARATGLEEHLTGAQIRQSRFLHIRESGRDRIAFALSRLDDASLERLPVTTWVELVVDADSAGHYLLLELAPTELVEDGPTSPHSAMLMDFTRDLRQIVERTRVLSVEDDEFIEADSFTAEEPLPAAVSVTPPPANPAPSPAPTPALAEPKVIWSQAPVEFDAGAWDVEVFDEAHEAAEVVEAGEAAGEPSTSPPVVALDEVTRRPAALAAAPPPSAPAAKAPSPTDPMLAVHPRTTTLVRHFRRRIAELEARVNQLEAELAQARNGR